MIQEKICTILKRMKCTNKKETKKVTMTVDVIIPTYKPDGKFKILMDRLQKQEHEIHQIIILNTKSEQELPEIAEKPYSVKVIEIEPEDFDHGATRNLGARSSEADIILFMTQDAIPGDRKLVSEFVKVFEKYQDINLAYGRQLPNKDCSIIEQYTRKFNYPEQSQIKSIQDMEKMGIKTFFFSDVCAAYRRRNFLQRGGFEEPIIFSEDMIYAGRCVFDGERIAYVSEARVFHSHNYTCMQQFHRNFDVAVSQKQHPELFENISSEGEGIRMVVQSAKHLLRIRKPWLIVKLILQSGSKYLGYFLGKRYQKLPSKVVLWCTSSKRYWENA